MPATSPSQVMTASVSVKAYLAEYARSLFGCGRSDGAVRIPPKSELYLIVWEQMERTPRRVLPAADANLTVVLPSSRTLLPRKNPLYYGSLGPRASRLIEEWLQLRFNYEFHEWMMVNEEEGRPVTIQQRVADFIRRHRLASVSDEALLKNFRRFRHLVCPRKVRKYEKRKRFKKN